MRVLLWGIAVLNHGGHEDTKGSQTDVPLDSEDFQSMIRTIKNLLHDFSVFFVSSVVRRIT